MVLPALAHLSGTQAPGMLVVIGCGNSNRSDDGVGVFVAQALQAWLGTRPRDDVRVFDAGTGGMDVMFQARGARKLVIVDASKSAGSPPGATFEVPGEVLAGDHQPSYSLHDFRWDHALAAGRKIFRGDFPDVVTVFLIEAASLELGLELSAPVRAAAQALVARLQGVVDSWAGTVQVERGNLYLTRETCERFLPGAVSVALLRRADLLLVVPLTPDSGGGLLLKVRNARGDRVVHAQEFFRTEGYLEDFRRRALAAHWNEQAAALAIAHVPRTPQTV